MFILVETYADNEAPEVETYVRLADAHRAGDKRLAYLQAIGLDNGWLRLYEVSKLTTTLIRDYL